MRHIGSMLVAAVFAPSIFLLTGTGLSAFHSALDDNKVYDPLGSLAALGALLLAGVLYGILVMARLSPLGPVLAGLAAWGASGWALFDIEAYQRFFSQLDVHMGGSVGETGLGILLGVPLLATLFSGRRWRRSELSLPPAARPRPDPAWVLPAAPVYEPAPLPDVTLPDIPPPSLRYPAAAAFPAPPLSAPPVPAPVSAPPVSEAPVSAPPASAPVSTPPASEAPALIVMAPPGETPPLPKRVPSRPPGNDGVNQTVTPQPPPDDELTERHSLPESKPLPTKPTPRDNEDETVQLRPES